MSTAILRVPEPRFFVSIAKGKEMLEKATTLLDAKRVKDVASAMREWARAQKEGQAAAQDAAEIVLRSERRLGQLSKSLPKAPRGGSGGTKSAATAQKKSTQLGDLGIDRFRAAEYEKIAAIPEDAFEEVIATARAGQREITTASALRVANGGRVNAKFSSESVEWYTPEKYICAARNALGDIDLDPASSKKANLVVQAKKIFTKRDDALARRWDGRVFLNPPYALIEGESSAGAWAEKLIAEHRAERVVAAVLLVNAVTDAKWFQPLWEFPICFTDHRIEFYTPSGQPRSPVSGNAFVYLGRDRARFIEAFTEFGPTVARIG